jgi:hypothetical protein
MESVYSAVRTDFLYKADCVFFFKRLNNDEEMDRDRVLFVTQAACS